MTALFSLDAPALFAVFLLCGVAFFALGYGFLGWLVRREVSPHHAPLPAFIGAITTAWALALGFAAADVWTIRADAERAASEERSSLSRLAGMSRSDALNSPELAQALQRYATAVEQQEWSGTRALQISPDVEVALQGIRIALISIARSEPAAPLVDKMAQDFDELQDARNKRLAIAQSSVSDYKWYLVLFLTMLSLVVIVLTHYDRPKSARNAIGVFVVASFVSLWILALHASPYAGAARIEFRPSPMVAAVGSS